jgi:hypothetical protein
MLSVLRLHSIDDRIINEYGAAGRVRIGRGNQVLGENLPQCHLIHPKSHMTWPRIKPGPPQWEAGD